MEDGREGEAAVKEDEEGGAGEETAIEGGGEGVKPLSVKPSGRLIKELFGLAFKD